MGCIYMYTNKINGKSYIGQTIRPLKVRHWQHLSQHETYFDRALAKYGKENFTLEVLEDGIYDLDELNKKEEYYISKYDTFHSGYNLNRGGNNKTYFSEEDRNKIISLLQNTNLSLKEIGEKTGYTIYTISEINTGKTFPKGDIEYPIRKNRCSEKYGEQDYQEIVDLLKNTDLTFEEIAVKTNTDFSLVADINRGKRISWFSQNNFEIPIRKTVTHAKVSINLAKQVVQLLKKNDMSADEIGNLLGLPGYTVGSINRGKHKICKELNESFPIRKKEYRKPSNKIFSQYQLNQILDLLFFTNLSMEEISQRFNVSKSTITAINTGRNYRKQNSYYKFPLRQNKEYNIPIFSSVNE